ncbi:MAG: SEC-C metal-binding domain-containing protein, partial [bacterium]
IRKNLIDYDNVMNKQREIIYSYRRKILQAENLDEMHEEIISDAETILENYFDIYIPVKEHSENWDIEGLKNIIKADIGIDLSINTAADKKEDRIDEIKKLDRKSLFEKIYLEVKEKLELKLGEFPEEEALNIEKALYLQAIDNIWKDSLTSLEALKEGIGLRGYAQQNPLIEYQRESYELFINMQMRMKEEAINSIASISIEEDITGEEILEGAGFGAGNMMLTHGSFIGEEDENAVKQKPIVKSKKIGRNEPCPCGSGKKYKNCHGKNL